MYKTGTLVWTLTRVGQTAVDAKLTTQAHHSLGHGTRYPFQSTTRIISPSSCWFILRVQWTPSSRDDKTAGDIWSYTHYMYLTFAIGAIQKRFYRQAVSTNAYFVSSEFPPRSLYRGHPLGIIFCVRVRCLSKVRSQRAVCCLTLRAAAAGAQVGREEDHGAFVNHHGIPPCQRTHPLARGFSLNTELINVRLSAPVISLVAITAANFSGVIFYVR